MTYPEVVDYLNSFIDYEKIQPKDYKGAFRLERMKGLLAKLGNPQQNLKVIHIAGTKGKGSTAALIASILKESGYRAGLYTSPHLISFRERIQIDGCMIGEEDLCRITTSARKGLDQMRPEGLSFFEAYTAIAFLYFKEKITDFAIMETGLGGRLDATNAVKRSISVITPISYEHTRILGSTIRRIAREKADIIKADSICISAPQEKGALDVIERICKKRRAHLYLVGRDIHIDKGRFGQDEQYFNVWTRFSEYALIRLALRGEHQIINAATAIGAIEALRLYNVFIPHERIKSGISKTEWPGRMEIINSRPLVVADGAQNRASSRALIDGIKRHFNFRNLILVLGTSKDKDQRGICKELSQAADYLVLTRADNPRAQDPDILKKYFRKEKKEVFPKSKDAMDRAFSLAGQDDIIVVTGSLYLVGEVKKRLNHEKTDNS
ncbi:MAG: bifunctional folylpolyglutamate synthase/dihydrofolate synthase [Candidatus Omnitrophica bacterium]|nr:bifunctional folylpolyglutamate synthase/dihydrofolate synthase [Candidatus Omnitrophota bacterium]